MRAPLTPERIKYIIEGEIPARLAMVDLCRSIAFRAKNTRGLDLPRLAIVYPGSETYDEGATAVAGLTIIDGGVVAFRVLANVLGIGVDRDDNDRIYFGKRNGVTLEDLGAPYRCATREDFHAFCGGHPAEVVERAFARMMIFMDRDAGHLLPEQDPYRAHRGEMALACWAIRLGIAHLVYNRHPGRFSTLPIDPDAVPWIGDTL